MSGTLALSASWAIPQPGDIRDAFFASYRAAFPGCYPDQPNTVMFVNATTFASVGFGPYLYQRSLADELMVDTARAWLPRHANLWGVPQIPAAKAIGPVVLPVAAGTPVPIGIEFVGGDGTQWVSTATATAGSDNTATVPVAAEVAGASGNLPAGHSHGDTYNGQRSSERGSAGDAGRAGAVAASRHVLGSRAGASAARPWAAPRMVLRIGVGGNDAAGDTALAKRHCLHGPGAGMGTAMGKGLGGDRYLYHYASLPFPAFKAMIDLVHGADVEDAARREGQLPILPAVRRPDTPPRQLRDNMVPFWVLPLLRILKTERLPLDAALRRLPEQIACPSLEEARKVLAGMGLLAGGS